MNRTGNRLWGFPVWFVKLLLVLPWQHIVLGQFTRGSQIRELLLGLSLGYPGLISRRVYETTKPRFCTNLTRCSETRELVHCQDPFVF